MRLYGFCLYCFVLVGFFDPSLSAIEDDLLPSDAPMTMMDRINTGKVTSAPVEVQLTTSLGTIIGLKVQCASPYISNKHHYAFRGIPYAEAPIDELRMKDPVELEGKWPGGILNATRLKSFCPQFNFDSKQVIGEEDCLYLNVYTPFIQEAQKKTENDLLPVFVFIHGGGFTRGSSSAHGAEKLLTRDLVLVTFNYRLGMLGFMSTEDSILPGNYGMLDQVSALRWVQRHISEFGGDPEQVTLGGFSAGAVSVHLHMHSPLSKDLFHRGIMMSGSALCPWAIQEKPGIPKQLVASRLSCPTSPSSALASCVASKDYKEIVKAQASIFRLEYSPYWVAPVVDRGFRSTPFLPDSLEMLHINPKPTIISWVPNEGLLFVANAIVLTEQDNGERSLYKTLVPETFTPWEDPEVVPDRHRVAEIYYFTSPAKTTKDTLLEEFTEAFSDWSFIMPVIETAAELANSGAPVYTYMLSHRDARSPSWAMPLYQRLWNLGYTTPLLKSGISHGDDLIHLFSFPYAMEKNSDRDQRVSDIMLSLITSFIINGQPQGNDNFTSNLPLWTPLIPGQPVGYYNVAVHPTMVHRPFRYKEQHFWRKIIPAVIRKTSSKGINNEENRDSLDDCPPVI